MREARAEEDDARPPTLTCAPYPIASTHSPTPASGSADVSISGVGKVSTASRGSAFGELALLHDAPRAATVVASSALSGYTIDALTFKCLLMGKSQQDTRDGVGFLSAVKLLSPLDEAQKRELASTATERRFDAGANIICEGERARILLAGAALRAPAVHPAAAAHSTSSVIPRIVIPRTSPRLLSWERWLPMRR